MKRILPFILLFLPFISYAINVDIENPYLDLNAKNDAGNPVISAHCKLTISGIKGKKFDLVAIVKDDDGEWHKNSSGNIVKTHYTCEATYESTVWKDIQVWLKRSKLSPKKGKHTYHVYLYVYYKDKWYGGVDAGTYNLTGSGGIKRGSRSSRSTTASKSRSTTTTVTCSVCNGRGITTCLLCSGMGGSNQYRCLTVPPYTSYYEWIPCMACGGNGAVGCTWCNGTGEIKYSNNNNYNSNSNYNYNSNNNYNYNSNNSSSGSSTSDVCRICGGSGICTSCNNTGGEWRDTGYYTGSGSKSWIPCPSCNGNKHCFNCHGTGRQ